MAHHFEEQEVAKKIEKKNPEEVSTRSFDVADRNFSPGRCFDQKFRRSWPKLSSRVKFRRVVSVNLVETYPDA
jgi:hypothetical protein